MRRRATGTMCAYIAPSSRSGGVLAPGDAREPPFRNGQCARDNYGTRMTWPRISPPGLFTLWMLR